MYPFIFNGGKGIDRVQIKEMVKTRNKRYNDYEYFKTRRRKLIQRWKRSNKNKGKRFLLHMLPHRVYGRILGYPSCCIRGFGALKDAPPKERLQRILAKTAFHLEYYPCKACTRILSLHASRRAYVCDRPSHIERFSQIEERIRPEEKPFVEWNAGLTCSCWSCWVCFHEMS